MTRHLSLGALGLLLAAALVTGCGGGASLTPVKGKVTKAGEPLPKGTVTFYADASQGNTATATPMGQIGEGGEYEVFTEGNPGAPAGVYKVTVVATAGDAPEEAEEVEQPEYLVPSQYMNVAETPLTIEVKPDAAEGAYDIKID